MSNKRDLRLDGYGIGGNRYRELLYFCLQYDDYIKERQSCYSLDGVQLDGMPRGNALSDTTANKAARAVALSEKIEMIEQTAIEAGGDLYPWLLKAVTKKMTWDDILPPCGRSQFYGIRRKFFFLLNSKK